MLSTATKTFILSLFLFLVSCTAKGPMYSEREPLDAVPDGYARITLYRVYQYTGSMISYSYCMDNIKVASLGTSGYTHFLVRPGDYNFTACSFDYVDNFIITLEEGQDYYLRQGPPPENMEAVVDMVKFNPMEGQGMILRGIRMSFTFMKEEFAKDEIKTFKFQKPKIEIFDPQLNVDKE